jgi:hypothetical protein
MVKQVKQVLSQAVPSVPTLFPGQWDRMLQFAPVDPILFCGASGAFSNFPVMVSWKRGKMEILFQVVPSVPVVSGGTVEQNTHHVIASDSVAISRNEYIYI